VSGAISYQEENPSEKVSSIKAMVEECLRKLVKSYEEHEEDFLTERDAVCTLFCMLKDEMKKGNEEGFKIHSELRPYIEGKNTNRVIKQVKGVVKWKEHKPKNSGAVVDIVIVSSKQKYFERAKEFSSKKYWRLVTYPLEAFVACIEVKIRVSGNIKRIEKDIDKLCKIRDTKKNCLVYLVVVDRKASADSKKRIEKCCRKNGVPLNIVSQNQTIKR